MVRAPHLHRGGWGFESLVAHSCGLRRGYDVVINYTKSEAEAAASAAAFAEAGAATMTGELPLLDSGMHLGNGLSKGGV